MRMTTPPRAKNGSTKTVKPASVSNPGDDAKRMTGKGGRNGALTPTNRASGRVVKGANPGVQAVRASGNAHGNAAMAGYPHKATSGRGGRRNITAKP